MADVLIIKAAQLWQFLLLECQQRNMPYESYVKLTKAMERPPMLEADYDRLMDLAIHTISVDIGIEALGIDSVFGAVLSTSNAIKQGFDIYTWHGPRGEVLIVGVRPSLTTPFKLETN